MATTQLDDVDGVEEPGYDRSALTSGIVHIGVGQFHRSHLAVYLDDLFDLGKDTGWAVRGVGLRAEDGPLRDALLRQDCCYSVTVKHPDGTRATRVIGSLIDYVDGYTTPEAAIEQVADPRTRIVSLTITEGGYNIDQRTGRFRLDEKDVAADLAGEVPHTVFGVVCQALRRRRDRGLGPVTILSCDNVQGNGKVARRAFTTFAHALDPRLAGWIADNVTFPSTMVDRITPPTTADDVAELRARTGLEDSAAVMCEPFRQFVVEDNFAAGRPRWEAVGVEMVDDVAPYEQMKLRLLNAPHQILAHFGILAGYSHTAEAMRDEQLAALVRVFQEREAIPTIPTIAGVDLTQYAATVRARFANPQMDDTLVRIATSASARIPNFLLPVVRDRLRSNTSFKIASATVAAWVHRLRLVANGQLMVPVPDEVELVRAGTSPTMREVLALPLFGGLGSDVRFVRDCSAAAAALAEGEMSTLMAELTAV